MAGPGAGLAQSSPLGPIRCYVTDDGKIALLTTTPLQSTSLVRALDRYGLPINEKKSFNKSSSITDMLTILLGQYGNNLQRRPETSANYERDISPPSHPALYELQENDDLQVRIIKDMYCRARDYI